jgi:hypothetical protein
VSPVSGSITNGGTRALTLDFNTNGLRAGIYRAHLRVGEGTPYDVTPVDITLTVLASGQIYLPVVRR